MREERPDLEEQKDNLVISIASGRKQLQELEDEILRWDFPFLHSQQDGSGGMSNKCQVNPENGLICHAYPSSARVCSTRLLNEATGSLLDDVQLVNTLQTSKVTATKVTQQLETSEQTEAMIDSAREV